MRNRFSCPIAGLLALALAFATSLFSRGQVWDFLGYALVDGSRDHGKIQIRRRDRLFRDVQLRVSGEAIFVDRLVFHFGNGTSQLFVVGERISSEGRNYVIDFPGERRVLESVELWYYKEPWGHNPSVSLYGIHSPVPDGEDTAREH